MPHNRLIVLPPAPRRSRGPRINIGLPLDLSAGRRRREQEEEVKRLQAFFNNQRIDFPVTKENLPEARRLSGQITLQGFRDEQERKIKEREFGREAVEKAQARLQKQQQVKELQRLIDEQGLKFTVNEGNLSEANELLKNISQFKFTNKQKALNDLVQRIEQQKEVTVPPLTTIQKRPATPLDILKRVRQAQRLQGTPETNLVPGRLFNRGNLGNITKRVTVAGTVIPEESAKLYKVKQVDELFKKLAKPEDKAEISKERFGPTIEAKSQEMFDNSFIRLTTQQRKKVREAIREDEIIDAKRKAIDTRPLLAPSEGDKERAINIQNAFNIAKNLNDSFDANFVGRLDNMKGTIKEWLQWIGEDEADFRKWSFTLKNAVLKAQSGLTVRLHEEFRIKMEIPDLNDGAVQWKAKMKGLFKGLRALNRINREIAKKSGAVDISLSDEELLGVDNLLDKAEKKLGF